MTIRLVVKDERREAISATKILTFEDLLITLGSGQAASVLLDDPQIAAEQAVIVNEDEQPLFINQSKGTILNGAELEQGLQHKLQSNDRIVIGSFQITVVLNNRLEPKADPAVETQVDFVTEELIELELPAETLIASKEDKLDVRSFKEILKDLRQEEDQFYFQITDADGAKRRLAIETDETILGWNHAENIFTSNHVASIEHPQAIVRKDWSGVTIYPSGGDAVLLNDALLEAATLLRNNDKITFSRRATGSTRQSTTQSAALVFCEPAALIELNAILPQELLNNALDVGKTGEIKAEPEPQQIVAAPIVETADSALSPKAEKISKRYFNYFTFAEVSIMVFATLLITALTYLLLEFS